MFPFPRILWSAHFEFGQKYELRSIPIPPDSQSFLYLTEKMAGLQEKTNKD